MTAPFEPLLRADASAEDIRSALNDVWRMPREQARLHTAFFQQALMQRELSDLGELGALALIRVGHFCAAFELPGALWDSALRRAEAWAEAHDRQDVLSLVYSTRGNAMTHQIDLAQSLQWLGRAVVCAQQSGATLWEAMAWNRMGRRFSMGGLVESAVQAFLKALAIFENQGDASDPAWQDVRRLALGTLAWDYTLLNDLERALEMSDRALFDQACAPLDDATAALQWSTRGRILLRMNRLREAEAAAQHARALALRCGDESALVAADLVVGTVCVASGDVEHGLDVVRRAVERGRNRQQLALHTLLVTAADVYERAGQTDVARMYLHELAQLKQDAQDLAARRLAADVASFYAGVHQPARVQASAPAGVGNHAADRERLKQLNRLVEEHAVAAERLDDTTGKHCYRVGRMAALLGEAVGLDGDVCFMLDLAARLHDVGKLAVPESILMKPGQLTDAEREVMQSHTVAGWQLLSNSNIPQMHIAQEIARHHHEWWDGSGYPDGLRGTHIPVAARVSALADVFDALTHRRPYKEPWTIDAALTEISRLQGRQFDPELTAVFLALVARMRSDHGDDLDSLLAEAAASSPFVLERSRLDALMTKSA